ncbi:ABC transporter substrate-binding protein [Kushneria indalinina]|uniref:Monosaccharide ABC transporter substrate-binding protein (CUT2 family) n=1 Tax=Kushneria indalinina DSM 14324 TaxID=1122140 RepID=A0A3D9DT40_9GAMM|nr:ABC transporter substrate-binding protein [Kushneria indalinina]REC93584.1 monosaccharide ABC transporter substrate-binding protein (CUT2 family) [Kushneria indalinina DSM 14324]
MPITIPHAKGLLGAALVSALLAIPAAQAAETGDKADDELVIGMSFQELNNVYFVTMQRALQEAVNEMGASLVFTDARHDIAKQINDVEDMLQRGVDILLLNPTDSVGIQSAVMSAHDAGVPVVAVDAQAEGPIDGFVGSKNFDAGYKACHYMGEQLGGEGKVAILDGIPVIPILERVEGCQKALGEFESIEVVDKQNGHQERSTAMNVTENMLQAHPDLAGIFSVNDVGSLGALVAIQSSGMDVKLASVDGNPEAVKVLAQPNSPLIAIAAQHPATMVVQALELAVKKYRGEESPSEVPIDVTLVTADNAKEFTW